MTEPGRIIAILAASPALSAVLSMVLASDRRLRVREFDNAISLRAYMRIVPVAVLVCDFDRTDEAATDLVSSLRTDIGLADPEFQVIGLTRTIDTMLRHDAIAAGIDEVIVKPMSPRHLLERVQMRLKTSPTFVRAPHYRGPDRRNRLVQPSAPAPRRRLGENVIELFPARSEAPSPAH